MSLLNSLKTVIPQSMSPAINTKVAEAASFVQNEFTSATAAFRKLTAGPKTIKQAAGEVGKTINGLTAEGAQRVAALSELSQRQAEDALTYNSLTAFESTELVRNAVDADVQARLIEEQKKRDARLLATGGEGDDNYKVKLVGISRSEMSRNGIAEVIFDVMPEVTEGRNVDYEPIQPAQFPGAFQKYKGTSSTDWTINANLISRTSSEAYKNLRIINQLRAWTMPFFGANIENQTNRPGQFPGMLGAPPPVLTLSGWRSRMVGPVPVVITSLNWVFPVDVDYIPATPEDAAADFVPIPFPVFIRITIVMKESFSTEEFNNFSLVDFSNGLMVDAFRTRVLSASNELQTSTQPGIGSPPIPEEAGLIATLPALPANLPSIPPGPAAVGAAQTNTTVSTIREASWDPETEEERAARRRAEQIPNFRSGGGGNFGGGGATAGW